MRLGVVGPQGDGLAEGGLRLRVLLLLGQGDAEVVVRLGVVGPQGDGLAEGGLRLRVLLLLVRAMPRLLCASG